MIRQHDHLGHGSIARGEHSLHALLSTIMFRLEGLLDAHPLPRVTIE